MTRLKLAHSTILIKKQNPILSRYFRGFDRFRKKETSLRRICHTLPDCSKLTLDIGSNHQLSVSDHLAQHGHQGIDRAANLNNAGLEFLSRRIRT
jgi:hypothetical protein